jgi:CheY-like chemotaxis protein
VKPRKIERMKRLQAAIWRCYIRWITPAVALTALVLVLGCEGPASTRPIRPPAGLVAPYQDVPPVDLPVEMRQHNWGSGSCMYAAFIPLLRWGGREDAAAWVRHSFEGDAGILRIAAIMSDLGIACEFTTDGDEAFLQWASDRRLGAAIYWSDGWHAITFCGFVGQRAVLIDDNFPERAFTMDRREFLKQWRSHTRWTSGGCAITPLLAPPPPRAWIRTS